MTNPLNLSWFTDSEIELDIESTDISRLASNA